MFSARAACKFMTNSNLLNCSTGQIAWLFAFEDPRGIDPGLPIHLPKVRSVTHQPADFDENTVGIGRRHPLARGEDAKLDSAVNEKSIAGDEERIGPFLRKGCKDGIKIGRASCRERGEMR